MKRESHSVASGLQTFMTDAGWCWFQDPRAVIHEGTLYTGGVQGNGSGSAVVGRYDLEAGIVLGRDIVHREFDCDDHNAPVFYVRPDGRMLTVYARHHRDNRHCYRISEPGEPLVWGEERVFRHDYPGGGNVTYMNLFKLQAEDKLYNFYRGIGWNPCYMTSCDEGETWGEPTHFIRSDFSARPYARYASDGVDTVHVLFTDAHPRDFGNRIYYAAFRGGKYYRANGALIKDLQADGPLRPSEAERIGTTGSGEPRGDSDPANSAWASSIVLDASGKPHVAYSLHLGPQDLRFRVAHFDGTRWQDREVAFAGRCLYPSESSYTGGITLDPVDPFRCVISTDVDPSTGETSGSRHEIYSTRIGPADDVSTLKWEPLTAGSDLRNIRPVIVNDAKRRVTLWMRGRYDSFTDYETNIVGLVEAR